MQIQNIVLIFICLLGITFFGMGISVSNKLKDDCPSSMIKNGWILIQTLGACMIASVFSFWLCIFRKGCEDIDHTNTSLVSLGSLFLINVCIIGVSIGILVEIGKTKNYSTLCDSSDTVKSSSIVVLVFSMLCSLILGVVSFIAFKQ